MLKALEKDRERRYESPSALLRDIQRYVSNEPVEARPPTTAYLLGKFASKYRIGLGVSAAFVLLLVAATIVSIGLAKEARRASQEAGAITSFLQDDLLGQASPKGQITGERPDRNITVRTLLDRANARVSGRFNTQPQMEASIRLTIGTAYGDLGMYEEASNQLEHALELRRRSLGSKHPDTLIVMSNLAAVYDARGLFDKAGRLFSDAITGVQNRTDL